MEDSDSPEDNLLFLKQYVGPCPYCDFQLNAPTSDKCPECGNILEITLASPFKFTSWLLMFVGLTASIAIVFNFFIMRVAGWYFSSVGNQGFISAPWVHIIALIVLCVALTAGCFAWVSMRRWVHAQSKIIRVFVGVIGVVLPLVVIQGIVWVVYRL